MQNLNDPYISEKPLPEDEYYRKELIRESRNDRYFWERHQQLTDINLERYDKVKEQSQKLIRMIVNISLEGFVK